MPYDYICITVLAQLYSSQLNLLYVATLPYSFWFRKTGIK